MCSTDELQRAAPIVSGFLLGYVAMLPLIGRIADLRGRVPVLVGSLLVFAVGSLVTALAYDMPSMVAGRFLQGVGGGGLVPGDAGPGRRPLPAERRGVPLGVVSAVQELGSVLGPLFGAVVLAVADWRAIFLINLAVGLVLAAAIRPGSRSGRRREPPDAAPVETNAARLPRRPPPARHPRRRRARVHPARPQLLRDLTWGQPFIPFAGDGRWLTPLGAGRDGGGRRCSSSAARLATRPLVDLPRLGADRLREADLVGALLLAVALAGVILAFATADPKVQVFSDQGGWFLARLGDRHRRCSSCTCAGPTAPLVPRGALRPYARLGRAPGQLLRRRRPDRGADRHPALRAHHVYRDSQLLAALVLVRFLVALPVGAVLGGYLTRRVSPGRGHRRRHGAGRGRLRLDDPVGAAHPARAVGSTSPLVAVRLRLRPRPGPGQRRAAGQHRRRRARAWPARCVVVARMVGMLVGISALTTIGLRRYYAEQDDIPPAREVCDGKTRCTEFSDLLRGRDRPGAHRLRRRRGLRGRRRRARPRAVPCGEGHTDLDARPAHNPRLSR